MRGRGEMSLCADQCIAVNYKVPLSSRIKVSRQVGQSLRYNVLNSTLTHNALRRNALNRGEKRP